MTRSKLTDEERAARESRRRASATGRKARRAGADAEVLVLQAAERAAVLGLARVWRCGKRGAFQRRGDVGTPVDFLGYWTGGRAIVAEVKSTSARSVCLRPRGQPIITDSERVALSWAAAEGAWAVVVVRARERWWVVEWPAWLEATAFAAEAGRKSLSPEALTAAGTEVAVDDGRPMWLEGLR